ncbi:MAG TPA: helix-turn-helix domain-containing protein [Candidatus Bathyarchaeia archaeon]|jgi:excisionase family DNA binding protein|nr:helix-turn-helix domain-containing protein [Candidatus Bathyarchaeia archaeon]
MARTKHPLDLLTPTQAAELLKLTRQGIVKAIQEGHLLARRYGRLYLIELSALERYRATRKPPGRPPGTVKKKPSKKKRSPSQ